MGNKVNRGALCGILLLATALSRGVVAQQPASEAPPETHAGGARLQQHPGCGTGCLKCEPDGCAKCRDVIVLGTRECRERCPPGHTEDWSTRVDYMGRLCIESSDAGWLGKNSRGGLGGRGLAVLVGAASGAGICVLLLLAGCVWVACTRTRRSHVPQPRVCSENLVQPDQWITPQEAQKRREFVKQVAALRPEAPVFLAMLNDTRRKVRQLYRPNGTDSRSKAYRTVLRDLSRLLTLLNRPEERLGSPPPDWTKLLAWAERSLRRYKKSCSSACSSGATSSASSTPSSSHALTQLPGETQTNHSILQLPSDCGQTLHHEAIEVPALLQTSAEWSQHAALATYYESCGFYPLGLRPQDEITTEL